ncbi:Rab GDP dissociation inhibitor alpha [Savitreella phatthalungensis]
MDETYDVIVLGTGLTECVLSGLLSVEGKKVLHMDRNDYYGGESASLTLSQAFAKYRQGADPPSALGRDRDWAIDLVPKFLMANGELTNMLVHTDVTKYLEFKQIAGSYVYRDGRIAKVPATEMEAVRSSLMGIFEKRRMKRFLEFIQGYKDNDASTQQGINLDRHTMAEIYYKFGLEKGTQDFVGHAMALHLDDSYQRKPARDTFNRILLYAGSVARYGKSPYLYPLYGLGELPQGFARLSAIYGGTYMLDKSIDEVVYGTDGKVIGVRSGEETAKAPCVIGDPSYFRDKVRKTGRVVRVTCILSHPIANTDNSDSVQIIIPQNQIGRKHDIYIAMVSFAHNVAAKNHYLAIVSTIVETDNPQEEVKPGLQLLGPIVEQFTQVSDLYEPTPEAIARKDGTHISKSYDATSHFETTTDDVKRIYRELSGGKDLVLKPRPQLGEDEDNFNVQ